VLGVFIAIQTELNLKNTSELKEEGGVFRHIFYSVEKLASLNLSVAR